MAQELDAQLMTVERALGERMIESALVIVRSWLNELGENNPYEEAHTAIRKRYNELFSLWLTSGDEQIDVQLNKLTGEAFQLVDAVYADLRLARGLSPDMHGFNQDSPQSVMNYFLNCVRLRPEDIEWLHKAVNDDNRVVAALMATSSLAHNLRECFSIDGIKALIDGMTAENSIVAAQCIASVLLLLIQYDVRIDFFHQVQESFVETVRSMDDEDNTVINVLCTLIASTTKRTDADYAREVESISELPDVLQQLFREAGVGKDKNALVQWFPSSEMDYLAGLMRILPDTWVYDVLTADNASVELIITQELLKNGYRESLWEHPTVAEQVFREKLRKKGTKTPQDYINYAHCLLFRGDRMMAYENYRQARNMCKNVKDFYNLFRPDRGNLVDHGVPLEQVYLIEDQLFQG